MDFSNKKIFFLDMDGTIYNGDLLIDGALPFFNECRKQNIEYVFLTNNSSKNNNSYYKKLQSLGIPCNIDNIYSSIDATIYYLKEKNYKSIYLLGTTDFYNAVKDEFDVHVGQDQSSVDCVVLGFDRELNYEKLEVATRLLEDGTPFVATNPDFRCPIEDGRFIPDCGTMIYMLEKTTGSSPFVIGKPRPFMIEALLKNKGYKKEEAVMVGDRLYTDVMCGLNAGVDSVLVLSGETKISDVEGSTIKPTIVLNSIKDIYKKIKK